MEPNRFDVLTRLAGSGQSRRRMLKTLAGGALAAMAGVVGLGEADAAAKKRAMGVVCSKNADCLGGFCLPKDRTGHRYCGCGSPKECSQPIDRCQTATCTGGVCGSTPLVCDDGNRCTTDSCVNGNCVFTPITCPKIVCMTSSCSAETGACVNTPINCDDGNACTTDSCDPNTGNCVHTPIVCPPVRDKCVVVHCDQVSGCVHDPKNCDDGNPCKIDSCDSLTGTCLNTPVDDGTVCPTGVCHSGYCCTPDDQATTCAGKCGTQTNNCGQSVACGGNPCDGACCTGRQTCSGGACCGAIYQTCDPANDDCCNASTCKAVSGGNVCCGVSGVSPCNSNAPERCCSGRCSSVDLTCL